MEKTQHLFFSKKNDENDFKNVTQANLAKQLSPKDVEKKSLD